MRVQSIALLLLLSMLAWAKPAHAARSFDNCTGFITSVPTVISTPGTWCLKQDVATTITSGDAIKIAANNVVVDCNDFRVDGIAAGLGTATVGIYANNRTGDTVRNCRIRGFYEGLYFQGTGGRHLIEHNHFDQNRFVGLRIEGGNTTVRYNEILDTGGTTTASDAYAIAASRDNDLIGNTISGVAATKGGNGHAFAFSMDMGTAVGGSIIGNRVRGLLPDGAGQAFGIIFGGAPQRMAIRDNDIVGHGNGDGNGINCNPGTTSHLVRLRNNVVSSFNINIGGECGDAGENDDSP